MKSTAERLGFLALVTAPLLFFLVPWLAIIPLCTFLIACLIAPFCPRWSFFLPQISSVDGNGIALTFDDGPSPYSTPIVLRLLKKHKLQATFFVIGKKAAQYPELISAILTDGHSIGNHSWKHDNLLMLRCPKRLRRDIRKTQDILAKHAIRPLLFRAPAGITGPRLQPVLKEEQLTSISFSCRAFDRGNKKIAGLARRILSCLQPGTIILLHDLPPKTDTASLQWQRELSTLLESLQQSALPVLPLSKLLNSEVMLTLNTTDQRP